MRAAKVDSTQAAIVQALRKMGAACCSTATLGKGAPDLLVAFRESLSWLEVKTPGEGLNAAQRAFHASWPGVINVVETPEQAMRVVAEAARPKGSSFPHYHPPPARDMACHCDSPDAIRPLRSEGERGASE